MRAPRRLLPAAVFFVIQLAVFAAEVRAQGLDSAGALPTDAVADVVAAADAVAEPAESEAGAPAPQAVLELLQSSALPTGVIEIHGRGQDLPVPLNQRVLSYVELFQGRLHEFIEGGMKRGTQYLPMIQQVFRAEGLPIDLAYVPLIESSFRPDALSRASARGGWQFIRGTALENGLKHDWYVDERSDPKKATVAAANYLKTLAELFDGDWHLALASYNSGPGRVQRAIKQVGRTDFWSISAKPRALPRETREYVPMILAAIVIARNPAQYGFSIESDETRPAFETVAVSHPVDLRKVAEWAGTTLATIHELNPELRRQTTPKDAAYELKVPAGTSAEIARRLTESDDIALPPDTYYKVKRGDTMPAIARKLGVTRADLAEVNRISVNARLVAGQQLIIPDGLLPAARSPRPDVAPVSASTPSSSAAK